VSWRLSDSLLFLSTACSCCCADSTPARSLQQFAAQAFCPDGCDPNGAYEATLTSLVPLGPSFSSDSDISSRSLALAHSIVWPADLQSLQPHRHQCSSRHVSGNSQQQQCSYAQDLGLC
jgi:hypothetical protein